MRIGIYVDGFNLYYGGRRICGRSAPGWRWLDIRGLARTLVAERRNLPGATVHRVVYCPARVDTSEPSAQADQDIYLKALIATRSVDHIEYGQYVTRVRRAPLALPDLNGRPQLVQANWPIKVQDPDATE